MEKNMMILGQDQYYSLDTHKTLLNNNVLVVGASGAGKTRSIVTPNLLQATGSYIVTDPKGLLYNQYKDYLKSKGYIVKNLDFTNPLKSSHYNFFEYIKSTQDIVKVAHMLIYQQKNCQGKTLDPFWDEASQLLVQALIAYLRENINQSDRNLHGLLQMMDFCQASGDLEDATTLMDTLIERLEEKNKNSYAVSTYKKFRVAANRTLRSIMISINARLALFDTPELNKMTAFDDIDISSIGYKKTALFVNVSDTDRSLDPLVNLFFTQAMHELCNYADKECGGVLPVPVRFIMDDFATNCKIEDFPRMISSIRSRDISTMLMIQSESQLKHSFGEEGRTIVANCDSYVYLGGNDVETAKAISERCDVPLKKILGMPIGTNWIFRRGQEPVNGKLFDLEKHLREKNKVLQFAVNADWGPKLVV